MNDNHKHEQDAGDECEAADAAATMSDEALVTAYALGELEGAEHATQRARVEALVASNAGVREEVERIREVGDELSRELLVEGRGPAPTLSDEQRGAIERELAPPPVRRLRPWLMAAAGLAAVAVVVWELRPIDRTGTTAPSFTAPLARNDQDAALARLERARSMEYQGNGKDEVVNATGGTALESGAEGRSMAPTSPSADTAQVASEELAAGDNYREPIPDPVPGEASGGAVQVGMAARAATPQLSKRKLDQVEQLRQMGYSGAGVSGPSGHLTGRGRENPQPASGGPGGSTFIPANEPVALREIAPDDHDDRRQPEPCIYWRVQPTPGTEYYAPIVEQGFASPIKEPLSTFSIDVDTASYANVRRFLNNGKLPPVDAVRIEELVNYFAYDYPAPDGETPFATHVAVTECPWAQQHRLVRIGIKGKVVPAAQRAASNLVFLLDVSGSMDQPDKLPLLVASMKLLVQQLDERDRVAIVTYAGNAGLRLESTSCDAAGKAKVVGVLDSLAAGGSTAGAAGIQLAYQIATAQLVKGGTNRVILATDGDFNVGITDRESLQKLIEGSAKSGVFLSVLGFGEGNLKDGTAELLADKGNGNYSYIDSLDEGRRVLVHEMGGTLVTIAKDVKIQVEFNPAKVGAYRLIGYENRALAAQDFNDDRKDAGEIGAGHTVTALYEVVPTGVPVVPGVDPLKYQVPADLPKPQLTDSPDLLTVSLRWKQPDADSSSKLSMPVVDQGGSLAQAGPDASFAAAVAAFGMLLRGSASAGDASWDTVIALAEQGRGADKDGYRAEFIRLVQVAKGLSGR